MQETFRLGRIAGIHVGVNWSLLVVALLLATGLSSGRFPVEAEGYPDGAYLLAGAVTAVVFLGGVLAHELAHAVMARREGLEVDGITLWLLGGVTRIGGEAETPGAEVRVAGAGPAVSLALGAAFAVVGVLLGLVDGPDLLVAVVSWLAAINVVLAVFNVLPGAPLDGGRLLHAFLWWRHGDRLRATEGASRAGQVLGVGLIVLGFVQFAFGTAFGGGLWLSLVGWFLVTSARVEEGHARARHALSGLVAGDVMTGEPETVPGWVTVHALVEDHLPGRRHSAYPVERWDGGVAGLVTLSALRRVPAGERAAVRVEDVACPLEEVPVVAPDEEAVKVLGRLATAPPCAEGRALVLDGDRLLGIISPADVTRAIERAELSPAGRR